MKKTFLRILARVPGQNAGSIAIQFDLIGNSDLIYKDENNGNDLLMID